MHKREKQLFLLLAILLPGCVGSDKPPQPHNDRYDTFTQIAIPNHAGIMQIREAVAPKIDAIIQEELQVPDGVEFPRFHVPSWQREASRLTLYYLNGLRKGAESYLIDVFDDMQKHNRGVEIAKDIAIASPVNFFGNKQQYIVFSVDDPHGSLTALNKDIGDYARQAQAHYKEAHGQDLYDIEKSEKFTYSPHIALGRLQPEYFSKFVQGLPQEKQFRNGTPEEREEIAQRIRERIKQEVFPLITQMLETVPTSLDINSFCMYGYSDDKKTWRICLKEYPLKVG